MWDGESVVVVGVSQELHKASWAVKRGSELKAARRRMTDLA